MKNLKKYMKFESKNNFSSEIIDYKNNLTDEIILNFAGQIIRLQRNPKLTYQEQIESFKNRYKLSKEQIKKNIKKTKFNTEKVIPKTQTENTINFFRD